MRPLHTLLCLLMLGVGSIAPAQENGDPALRDRRRTLLDEFSGASPTRRRGILNELEHMRIEERRGESDAGSSASSASPDEIASWFEPLSISGSLGLGAHLADDGRLTRREVGSLIDLAAEGGVTEAERENLREVAEVYGDVMATLSHRDLVRSLRPVDGETRVYGVTVRDDAAIYVADAMEAIPSSRRRRAHRLLRMAARVDGNRVVSLSEARLALDPLLGGEGANAHRARIEAEVARERHVRGGVDVVFNSEGVGTIREKIIETLNEVVREADGKRVDINLLLFSFTDKQLAEEIVRLVEENENLHLRLLTDWTQLSESGSHKAPVLERIARERGLDRLEVKYKKDNPYLWSDRAGRPTYSHRHTRGLNHHKGFVALVDGRPVKLLSGSYNWSPTAESKNYENIFVLDGINSSSRSVLASYEAEFEAFWNDGKIALTGPEAREHKRRLFEELRRVHRGEDVEVVGLLAGRGDDLRLLDESSMTDVNGPDARHGILDVLGDSVVGNRVAEEIRRERLRWGRFESFEDLISRVPMVGTLPEGDRRELAESLYYGDGFVAVNTASEEDLVAMGITRADSRSLVEYRREYGDFERLIDLRKVPGVSRSDYYRMRRVLTEEVDRVAFSARAPHEETGDSGFAPVNEAATVPVRQPDGTVVHLPATLGAGAIDMIRGAGTGETIELATYGLSTGTQEYEELVEAARRGVNLRVILNPAYNGSVASALDALRTEEGLENVEVRLCRGKTMHEKFMVHAEGGDVFNGSANLSRSSSSKHSEDRFFFKNDPEIVNAFRGEFGRLWAVSVRP